MHRFVNGCVDSNESHGIFDWVGNFATLLLPRFPFSSSLSFSFPILLSFYLIRCVCHLWIWRRCLSFSIHLNLEASIKIHRTESKLRVNNKPDCCLERIHTYTSTHTYSKLYSAFAVCIRFASAAAIAATSNDRRNCRRNVEPYRRLWMHVWINVATAI